MIGSSFVPLFRTSEILGLPLPSTPVLIAAGIVAILCAVGAFALSRPRVKGQIADRQERAFGWIDRAILQWRLDGRLTDSQAEKLRTELREPDFTAMLPHFGVFLAIGVVLRFPIGSIARASYLLINMAMTHLRLVTRRIDHHTFRQLMGIHSPLVLVIACLPGIGTFAYLASKPFRSHHVLALVALDSVLCKLPRNIYERSGLRMAIARSPREDTMSDQGANQDQTPHRLRIIPAQVMLILTVIAGGLFAADIVMQTINKIYAPTFPGWTQLQRIFDLGSESSLGTWFAVFLLVALAGLLGLVAWAKHQIGDRFARHWAFLALLVLVFSIDEQAKFHDAGGGAQVREALGLSGFLYYGWVVIALASVAVIAYVYRGFIVALPRNIRNAFLAAAGFYVGGEVLVEMANGWIVERQGPSYLYLTMTSVEEFMGLIGVLIAVGAVLVYARTAVGTVSISILGPVDQPSSDAAISNVATEPLPRLVFHVPANADRALREG